MLNRKKLLIRKLLIFIIFCCNTGFSQKQYKVSPHVSFQIDTLDGDYIINYRFMDHFGNFQQLEMSYPVETSHKMINRFGIPKSMFESYLDTEENRNLRQKVLRDGLFRQEDNILTIDKSAVVNYYAEDFCKPIAEQIVKILAEYNRDTRLDRIEMAMSFVQDIPYGIPDYEDEHWHYGGMATPPEVLLQMYGDCDSKAILFTGILVYLIDEEDIVFLNQPDHVLTAIRFKPEKGQTYIKYRKKTFVIAETAGPARKKPGEKGNYYRRTYKAEPLTTRDFEKISFTNRAISRKKPDALNPVETQNNMVLKNASGRQVRVLLSPDGKTWKEVAIPSGNTGMYSFPEQSYAYMKIRDDSNKNTEYKIESGNVYQIDWSSKKRNWEVFIYSY